MASRKITQFTTVTSALSSDYIPLVREGEIEEIDRNKKITVEDLIPLFTNNLILTTSDAAPLNPPAQSPSSGILYVHIQEVTIGYGSNFVIWIGVGGGNGDNGWVFINGNY